MLVVFRNFGTGSLRSLRIFASLRELWTFTPKDSNGWFAQRRKVPQRTQKLLTRTELLVLIGICIVPFIQARGEGAYRQTQTPISSEAAKHFQLAQNAESRFDWKNAESEYREALKLTPDWA